MSMKQLIMLTFILLLASSCTGQKKVESGAYNIMLRTLLSHSVPEISVDSLQKIQHDVVLIDAREPEEFQISHIPNAVPVGYDSFDISSVDSVDKDKSIVVYCAVGYRSEKISEKLMERGFSNVSNLYGGIFEWVNRGNVVVNESDTTQKIHAYSKTWGIWLNKGEKVYSKQ